MGLLDRLFKRREAQQVLPAIQKAEPAKPAVRYEEIPNTLDLGWYWSENKQELQMAKVAQKNRATHFYVIGASGTGKTKFIEFLIQQDIEEGNGFGVIDPHGDLIEDIKGFLACHYRRSNDPQILHRVVLIDPTDPKFTVTFNPLEKLSGVSPAEQAQELISSFKKIWTDSWGVRMEDLLRNSLIALGEAGLTLVELPHFLTKEAFRQGVLEQVTHPVAREYFHRFNILTERARITWIEPVMNKINAFLADDRVRQMLSFPQSSFNIREVIDTGKILLVKLDKGKLRDSTDLLGSLFMAKIKLAAFSRSDLPQNKRTPFYLYIDEFQNFAADSFAVLLSEARKYGLSLIMAHQTLAQVPPELRSIILGNTGIQVYFRVNRHDAEILAKEAFEYSGYEVKTVDFYRGPRFWSLGEEWEHNFEELQNLPPRCCYVKHKIEGGIIRIQTAQIKPAWEVLGMGQEPYEEYLRSLPLGGKYVLERSKIEQDVAQRMRNILVLPEPANKGEEQTRPESEAEPPEALKPKQPTAENTARTERHEEPTKQPVPADQLKKESSTPVYKELVVYLEHIAEHPFLPALQRDEALQLTRYKGSVIRQRLVEAGYIKLHRVGTGTRSGQIVLQEITEAGYELLASMKIKVRRPKSRGGFLHKYYCYKLKDFAEDTWPGSVVEIEDASLGKPADVTVKMPNGPRDHKQRAIAFEVFMTGEAKEIRGIAKGIEVFDQVIVCAETTTALDSLKKKATAALGSAAMGKVSFSLLSQYLSPITPNTVQTEPLTPILVPPRPTTPKTANQKPAIHSHPSGQTQIPLKNRAKSESETEPQPAPTTRRGRKPKTPLMDQVEAAYSNLNNLDWLQECELVNLPEVQARIQPRRTMPEAQALRSLLTDAASQVIHDIEQVPDMGGMALFLKRYLQGKKISEIAEELGVSREWCSKAYRKEALRLAGMQFVRLVSVEDTRRE